MNKPRFSLNSSHLKILAMIIILIDHLGLFFVSLMETLKVSILLCAELAV